MTLQTTTGERHSATPERHPTDGDRPVGNRRRWVRQETPWLAAAVATTLAAVAVVLRLGRLRLAVPLGQAGDSKLALSTVQTVLEKGWYLHTDRLGAPLGQDLYDYPFPGDTLHLATFRFLGFFTEDPAVVLNVFYLLSFALVAASCHVALRALRLSRPSAAALGVLYACLPFHFLRGESHAFLSNYWVVPLSCFVVIRQLGREPLLDLSRERLAALRGRVLLQRPALVALAVCVAAGLTGVYYAAFTAILLVATGCARAVRDRRPAPALTSVLLATVVVGAVAASVVPSVLYFRQHGRNEVVAERGYGETEFYGLKLVNLVLPVSGHRLDALGNLKERTASTPIPGEGSETLGMVGTAGFLGLLSVGVVRLVGGRRADPRDDVAGHLSAATLVAVVVGTVAGLSAVIAAFGFTSLRGWNRISVVIGFLSLAAMGLVADKAVRSLGTRLGRATSLLHVGVAALLVTVGVWDQTAPWMTPDYRAAASAWDTDRRFVRQVEQALGRGAEVFQLPYAPFPEIPPIVDMADYEHMRGYLHSETLRWSYGAMKGRPASQWQADVATSPAPEMVDSLAVVGFEAIWIDRLGYHDRARDLVDRIQAAVGTPPRLTSPDNRFVVFDLRGAQERIRSTRSGEELAAARQSLLRPLELSWDEGFHREERSGSEWWRWAQAEASLAVLNDGGSPRRARLRLGLGGRGGTSNVELRWPDGIRRFTVTDRRQEVDLEVVLRPGRTRFSFVSDAPAVAVPGDTRDLRFRVLDVVVRDR